MNKGYIYLGTMTLAQKAKSLLAQNKIHCELVKKAGMEGCTWGTAYHLPLLSKETLPMLAATFLFVLPSSLFQTALTAV